MRFRLRGWLPVLMLSLSAAACADSPTSPPKLDTGNAGPSEGSVYVPGGPSECDPWLDVNWCEDPGDGHCMTSGPGTEPPDEYAGVQSCTKEPGGPGGGGAEPDEEPADSCNTGDPVVDDPEVSRGLQELWARSSPDANLAQRRETAGWIVQTSSGYSIVPISTTSSSFGCADFVVQPPTNGTIVGFVHTHPYEVGETIVDCEMVSIQDYSGAPSDEDRITSKLLGNAFGLSDALPGYIIDKDGYYRFVGSRYTAAPRLPRCGY
jgi:hypothetical protein